MRSLNDRERAAPHTTGAKTIESMVRLIPLFRKRHSAQKACETLRLYTSSILLLLGSAVEVRAPQANYFAVACIHSTNLEGDRNVVVLEISGFTIILRFSQYVKALYVCNFMHGAASAV